MHASTRRTAVGTRLARSGMTGHRPEVSAFASGVCGQCGRPLGVHDRDVRFRLPVPEFVTTNREQTPGTWMSHATPEVSVMMQVPEVGPFVR